MLFGKTLACVGLTLWIVSASDHGREEGHDEHGGHEPAKAERPAAPAKAEGSPKSKASAKDAAPAAHGAPAAAAGKHPADEALKKLLAGNRRFVGATMAHPNQTVERRLDQAGGQTPFAIIVSCSDSRVGPEVVFDQGLGDLFVVRTAGEVVTDVAMGSIEYAAAHLGCPLIMVMGHEKCGAVKATVEGGEAPGSIGSIVKLIKPAVEKAKGQGGDLLDNAIRNNAIMVAETIAASPIIKEKLAKGELKIVRGVYDLDEGVVKPVP
jgi:carbonic anhydrase